MNKRFSLYCFLLFACMPARLWADTSKIIPIPGTRISCIAPEGFSLSRGFVGLESIEYQTSILVMELPWPPTDDDVDFISFIKTQFNRQTLASKGLVLAGEKVAKIGGHDGIIFTATQVVNAVSYTKLLIFFAEKGKTVFQIQVACPSTNCTNIKDNINSFIKSIKVNDTKFTISLPYTLSLPEGWALAKQHGMMEFYTETGKFPAEDDELFLAVLNLHEKVPPLERAQWIHSKNTKRNHYTNVKVTSTEKFKVDGLSANISVVDCLSLADQKQITKFYCYIFLEDTTFLIETDKEPRFNKKRFTDICKSWKLKKTQPNKSLQETP